MRSTVIEVGTIAALDHEEAMVVASVEYDRVLGVAEALGPEDWDRPTDCGGWDVAAVLAHLLGMMELDADPAEMTRQVSAAGKRAQSNGQARIDALTAMQVEERRHLRPRELLAALRATAPKALAGRAALNAEQRAQPFDPGPPYDSDWTRGYLMDVIHTRDPWMHRVDIALATGTDVALTADHDGRIVADVVAEWSRRHGQPFTLVLGGPAGATFVAGHDGEHHELEAVEFCRLVSGRGVGPGLLGHEVPF